MRRYPEVRVRVREQEATMTPANGNGGPYNPTTGWRINSIGVSFDNETRRWCMRTHIYIPDVGNCICL
jgi:hypothetical protein